MRFKLAETFWNMVNRGRGSGSSNSSVAAAPPQRSLDELVAMLPEGARDAALIGLSASGVDVGDDAYKAMVEYRSGVGFGPNDLAGIAVSHGRVDEAISVLVGANFVRNAAELAKEQVGIDRAIQVYTDSIRDAGEASKPRWHEWAGDLYHEKDDWFNGNNCYRAAAFGFLRKGDVGNALEVAKDKLSDVNTQILINIQGAARANDAGYKGMLLFDAGKLAEGEGLSSARDLYQQSFDAMLESDDDDFGLDQNRLLMIADEKLGDADSRIAARDKVLSARYLGVSDPKSLRFEQGELAEGLGQYEKAAGFYVQAGHHRKGISLLFDNGHFDEGFALLEANKRRLGDKYVAHLAFEHGRPELALEVVQRSLAVDHECGTFRDPDYFKIAARAAGEMGNEDLKSQYLTDGIDRFVRLSDFDVCREFATLQGDMDAAAAYKGMMDLGSNGA